MKNRNYDKIKVFDVFDADGTSYIKYHYKSEHNETTNYYFERHKKCNCDDTHQCYRCTLLERPILKKLKSDDDFKRQDQLQSISRQRWITKLEQINAYKNSNR